MPYLLDANVLIALTIADHEHHQRVADWAASVDRLAVCPIVEGALVRFLVRVGERPDVAKQVLRLVREHPRCEFWSDDLSYVGVDLGHVRGHRQVTDAYLASLAASRVGYLLATLDQGLASALPDVTHLITDR